MMKILTITLLALVLINEINTKNIGTKKAVRIPATNPKMIAKLNSMKGKKATDMKNFVNEKLVIPKTLRANLIIGSVSSARVCARTPAECKANSGKIFVSAIAHGTSYPITTANECSTPNAEPSTLVYTYSAGNTVGEITVMFNPGKATNAGGVVTYITVGTVTAGICMGATITTTNTYKSADYYSCVKQGKTLSVNTTSAELDFSGSTCYGRCSGAVSYKAAFGPSSV